MRMLYPASLQGIVSWAKENRMTVHEAKLRFAQYGILQAMADSKLLRENLAFKGGNALDFAWAPNRSTTDLDFSCRDLTVNERVLQEVLPRAMAGIERMHGVAYRLQGLKRKPQLETALFPALKVIIGYGLPDDRNNRRRIEEGKPSKTVIELDISLNEVVCRTVSCDVQRQYALEVCALEDIIAEKLRALLQQSSRNRRRGQDVLDIFVCLAKYPDLNVLEIRDFLMLKAGARGISVTLQSFESYELRNLAHEEYSGYEETTRESFVPFEEAFSAVMDLVRRLGLQRWHTA